MPLATWGLLSAGIGAGNAWGSARVLIAFGIVLAVAARAERAAEMRRREHDSVTVGRPVVADLAPGHSSG